MSVYYNLIDELHAMSHSYGMLIELPSPPPSLSYMSHMAKMGGNHGSNEKGSILGGGHNKL